jgi:hypothetical protein
MADDPASQPPISLFYNGIVDFVDFAILLRGQSMIGKRRNLVLAGKNRAVGGPE